MVANNFTVGVLIAGGRSLRFGGEKAVADFGGDSLLTLAASRLQRSCARVAVNVRSGTQAEALALALGFEVLHDAPGDPDGPLAGVKAGLLWAGVSGATALAVSPCDAPLLPDELFDRLIAAAGAGAAVAETPEGLQPLCAIWPVSALGVVEAALADGAHPPTWRVLESLNAVHVRFEDAGLFANLNTRAELDALTRRLGTGARA